MSLGELVVGWTDIQPIKRRWVRSRLLLQKQLERTQAGDVRAARSLVLGGQRLVQKVNKWKARRALALVVLEETLEDKFQHAAMLLGNAVGPWRVAGGRHRLDTESCEGLLDVRGGVDAISIEEDVLRQAVKPTNAPQHVVDDSSTEPTIVGRDCACKRELEAAKHVNKMYDCIALLVAWVGEVEHVC